MTKGSIFIKLLVSLLLLSFLFSLTARVIFDLNNKIIFIAHHRIYDNQLLTAVNKIYFEVKSCHSLINTLDHPTDQTHISFISQKKEPTTYWQKNNRLARTTGGTFYLSPKEIKISNFKITRQHQQVTISFLATKGDYQHQFTRIMELINV